MSGEARHGNTTSGADKKCGEFDEDLLVDGNIRVGEECIKDKYANNYNILNLHHRILRMYANEKCNIRGLEERLERERMFLGGAVRPPMSRW